MSAIQPARRHHHNNHLQTCILAIKYCQQTCHSKCTSFLKSSHQHNKGQQLRHQLNRINSTHRLFLYLFRQDSPFLLQILHIIIRNRISNRNEPPYLNQQKSNYPHQTKSTTSLQSHYHLMMPSLYLTKELISSPPLPLPASLLSKKLSLPKSTQHSVHSSTRRTTPPESKHQTTQSHFAVSILTTNSFIHFLYYIKNNRDLTSTFTSLTMLTTLFHSLKNFYNLLNTVRLFILFYPPSNHTPHLTLQTYRTTMTL